MVFVVPLLSFAQVFIRELISNGSDALEKLRHRLITGGGETAPMEIHLQTDAAKGTLTIQVFAQSTHPQAHPLTHMLTHAHTHAQALTLSHTQAHTHTHTHAHKHTHTHTHTHDMHTQDIGALIGLSSRILWFMCCTSKYLHSHSHLHLVI